MQETQKQYFQPLTGLRGLAAILILLFHSMFPCFKALWIGVPVFFVLSGFLITRILIGSKSADHSLRNFYLKRAFRIFPIYYLALLVSVFWGLLVNADLGKLPHFIFYVQNFFISRDLKPDYCYGLMAHTWSLSVEELFYLSWPLIVFMAGRKTLTVITLLIGLCSIFYKAIMLCFFYNEGTDQLLMLSLFGNIDGLMAGAFLGILSLNKNSSLYRSFPVKTFLLSVIFFLIVFFANYHIYSELWNYSIFKALLSIATILLSFYTIAWFVFRETMVGLSARILENKFLLFTGKISYGLYLYHALIYGITEALIYHLKLAPNPLLVFVFKVSITFLAAIFSWNFIERPFLKLKEKINQRQIIG